MDKFCSNCGSKLQETSSFCSNCGNSLNVNNVEVFQGKQNRNTENLNVLKISALVIGIISILGSFLLSFFILPLAIAGLVLGIVYSCKSKKMCSGIILNIIGILLPIIIFILLVGIINTSTDTLNNNINDLWEEENDYDVNDNWYYEDNSDDDNDETSEVVDSAYFKEIGFNEFLNKIDNNETFVILISQTYCSHCLNYKPKLRYFADDYEINIYYIEYDLLNDQQADSFNDYVSFSGTPTTVFFKNGQEDINSTRIIGNVSVQKIETIFRSNGFIK